MNTENIKLLSLLTADASALRGMWGDFTKAISNPKCDKHDFGFNRDDRFCVFKCAASLDAYIGYYGSSSCSTFKGLRSGPKEIQRAFTAAINSNMHVILAAMADSLESRANKIKADARAEVAEIMKLIDPEVAE